MVRLTKVEIENYKLCKKTTLELNDGLTALIGPNGSGKTTLLEAVDIVKRAENRVYIDTDSLNRLVKNIVNFYFDIDGYECLLVMTNYTPSEQIPFPFYQSIFYFEDTNTNEKAEIGAEYFLNIKGVNPNYIDFKLDTNNKKLSYASVKIIKYLSQITYYNINNFEVPEDANFIDINPSINYYFNDIRDTDLFLINLYKNIEEDNISNYINIVKSAKLINNVNFIPSFQNENSYLPFFDINENSLMINQLSQGTLRALALIFYIMYDKGSLLLIEEPESFIHKGLLDTILDLIIRESKNKQFIITTHSDYVLDRLQPENIVLVENDPKKGIVANKLSKAMGANNFKALKAFLKDQGGLGEYWKTFDFEKK